MRRARQLRLESGEASIVVDLLAGRLSSCKAHRLELLRPKQGGPFEWGSFVMAPFAGRIGSGRFRWDGVTHQLPVNMAPHAIHGTVLDRTWTVVDDTTIAIDLGPTWPYPGRVTQSFELHPDRLVQSATLEVGATSPASIGWHPWFRRQLGRGEPAHIWLDAAFMFERGPDHLPTGRTVPMPPGPWDDCFGGLGRPPIVRWDGALELEVTSSCNFVVVYDEPADALCVEPQTAPPNAHNDRPPIVEPDRPLRATMTWRWRTL